MKANLVTAAISVLLAAFAVSAADNDLPRLKKSNIDGYYYADPDGTIAFGTGFRRATAFNSDGVAAVSFDGNRYAVSSRKHLQRSGPFQEQRQGVSDEYQWRYSVTDA